MKQRDKFKQEAKTMASSEGREASNAQAELWSKHKKLRNLINNRTKQEEIQYKKNKVNECQSCPSKTWGLAKKFMEWKSPGPPSQLEVEENKKITMYRKAKDLARIMNEYFISKVQTIIKGLTKLP